MGALSAQCAGEADDLTSEGPDAGSTDQATRTTAPGNARSPDGGAASSGTLDWVNPASTATTAEEGLYLVDATGAPSTTLDCAARTIVFVHGRTMDETPVKFPSPKAWRDAGWNTLLFRWQKRALDPALVPKEASLRTPAVALDLLAGLEKVRGCARSELRIAGHSLGAVVTSYANYTWMKKGGAIAERLELLDPAYLTDVTGADDPTRGMGPAGLTELGRMFVELQSKDVRIVAYITEIARIFGGAGTWGPLNRQTTALAWQGLDVGEKHNAAIPYYFESIAFPPPPVKDIGGPAFSASLPTVQVPKNGRAVVMTDGISTTTMLDDVYAKE